MKYVLILGLFAAVACDRGLPDRTVTNTDSAGIQIVESLAPAWSEGDGWTVDPMPLLSIGTASGDEMHQLYWVQGARRVADGTVIIANAGTGELRFFDSTGAFLQRVGRHGSGPGEFAEFSSMRLWMLADGRLAVSDQNNDRINVFAADGTYETMVRLEKPAATPRAWLVGVFGGGSLLVRGVVGGGRLQGPPGSIIRSTFVFQRYASTGEHLADQVEVAGRPRYVYESGGITRYPYIPFSQAGLVAVQGDHLLVLSGASESLTRYDSVGQITHLIRWNRDDRPRTEDAWPRYVEASLDGIDDDRDRRWYASYYQQDLPLPEYIPLADQLLVDALGYIWILRDPLSWEDAPLWDILSPPGEWLGSVSTPDDLTVHEIGADYVLGVSRDDLDVERVQLFTLDRSGSGAGNG